MSGTGLQGAYGLQSLDDLLRQRMQDQLAAQAVAEKVRQFNVGAGERAREHDLNASLRQDALDQSAQARSDALAAKDESQQNNAAENFIKTAPPMADVGPMAGRLRTLGYGSLLATTPGQQAAEGAGVLQTPPGAQTPQLFQPETNALPQGGLGWQAARAAASERVANANDAAARDVQNKKDLAQFAASLRPPKEGPQPHFTVQPEFDEQGKPTGRQFRVNSLTGELSLAQTPEGGARTKPGAQNATLDTRLASAKAVVQTGQDIVHDLQTDPQAGPMLGRYNSLRDFIGNPPPEYAALAGKIESYALANMGVHGMRSAQGAEQIKKVLDQRHTPASLIATINGLNGFASHLLENEGKGLPPAAAPAAPITSKYKVTIQ